MVRRSGKSDFARTKIACKKFDARNCDIDMLVFHYTDMPLRGALHRLASDTRHNVSAHYVIAQNGHVYALIPERHRAWHAGRSWWGAGGDLNHCAVGIELDYAPTRRGRHWDYPLFAPPQLASAKALARQIIARHKIPHARVLGHSDIAPARKFDPGPAFPWAEFAQDGIGQWYGKLGDTSGYQTLRQGESGPQVRQLQKQLAQFGYGVVGTDTRAAPRKLYADGQYGVQTQRIVAAFQRHFRPKRVNGVADAQTQAILAALLGVVQ